MASEDDTMNRWFKMDVCLMNKDDQVKKTTRSVAANKVHMKIKVDTGCTELALSKSLMNTLKLDYIAG